MRRVVRVASAGGSPKLNWWRQLIQSWSLDARVAMIQALIPVGLEAVRQDLKKAVEELVGPRYQRGPEDRRLYRWGSEAGSIYLADQKVPVRVPRVRDLHQNQEVRLDLYDRLQEPRGADGQLMQRILKGLGCRNYRETAALVPEAFGMSASTVSRRFIRASSRKLKELMERDLSGHDFVALFLDGKAFGDDEMVIAVGVTLSGEKVLLGLIQTASENAAVCRDFLKSLVDRGLRYEEGLLCVLDGAKGFHRAVRVVFEGSALIQRCRWHKRENVLKYLAQSRTGRIGSRLCRCRRLRSLAAATACAARPPKISITAKAASAAVHPARLFTPEPPPRRPPVRSRCRRATRHHHRTPPTGRV